MTVTDWLISIAVSSAGGAALLALAGYLGRAQLAHWLNRDLEAVKAKHQRELEQYKTQLVVEVERMKASNDVHKALAIKIAEKRFAAVDEVHRAFCAVSSGNLFTSIGPKSFSLQDRRECIDEVLPLISRFDEAVHGAQMFLSPDEAQVLMRYRIDIGNLAMYLSVGDSEFSLKEFESKELALDRQDQVCSSLLRAHIERLFKMTGS